MLITTVTTIYVSFKYGLSAILGANFGYFIIPKLVSVAEDCLAMKKKDAEFLLKKARKLEIKKLHKSPEFKKKVKEIEGLIKIQSTKGHRSMTIMAVKGCINDSALLNYFEKNGFEIECTHNRNEAKISW